MREEEERQAAERVVEKGAAGWVGLDEVRVLVGVAEVKDVRRLHVGKVAARHL